ncbi:MAG: response regulator [Elusimicrobiales bacterium]|nr:response regulator [Elusimicrobiales bacterium]
MNKIMIIDDSEETRGLIKKSFLKNGNMVLEQPNGTNAFKNILKEQPELIILDLNMPGKSGIDVLKEIRNDQRTVYIPVIILTGGEDFNKIQCLEIGADDYLNKPVNINELVLKVKNLIVRQNIVKGLHPLTQMPAAPLIEKLVRDKIEKNEVFVYMYIDMDNFKKYNDVFGYVSGDKIIKLLSQILKDIYETRPYDYFAGHIGGDDFVVVSGYENWTEIAAEITNRFDIESKKIREELLNEFNLKEAGNLPFVVLSVAAVTNVTRNITNYGKVVEIAFEVKKYLKSFKDKKKSMILMDRRKDPIVKE